MEGQIRDIFKECLEPASLQSLVDLVRDENEKHNLAMFNIANEKADYMKQEMNNLESRIISNVSDFIEAKIRMLEDRFQQRLENYTSIIAMQDEYIKSLESKIQNEGSSNR